MPGDYMNYNQDFLHDLVGMVSLLKTIFGTILHDKRGPYVRCSGPLISLILTVAQVMLPGDHKRLCRDYISLCRDYVRLIGEVINHPTVPPN